MTSSNVVYQDFDAEAFGVPFYRIVDVFAEDLHEDLNRLMAQPPIVIDAKLKAGNRDIDCLLQEKGFRKICTQINLAHFLDTDETVDEHISVNRALDLTESQIKTHAENFVFDRFSLDALLPRSGGKILYCNWIRNSVCGKRKELIAISNSFCSFSDEDETLRIDLVSVLEKRKNIGRNLLAALVNEAKARRKSRIEVVTECENQAAWRLYIRSGFRLSQFYSVFHYVDL